MEERAGRHCPQIVYTVSLLYYSLCVAQLANKKNRENTCGWSELLVGVGSICKDNFVDSNKWTLSEATKK